MRDPALMEPEEKFRFKLEIKEGHWYARIDLSPTGVQTWVAVGKSSIPPADAAKSAQLARWYYHAGILHDISTPIMRENGTDIIDVIGRSKATGELIYSTDGKTSVPFDEAQQKRYAETIGK
jgi:hypothetical protein